MIYARYRTTRKSEWRRLTITRSVLGVIALSGLAIGSLALPLLTEASHDRALNTRRDRLEQAYRLRERAPAANVNKMAMNAPPAVMLVSITVDRTDDTAAASACTGAPNDCSLRGAVSFANANPGTTIIVPAGTYQLTIPGGATEGFSGNNSIGDLDITGNNTAISGAGAATTIIQQTQPNDRVIEVNPFLDANFTTTISDVTISGGRETTGVGGGGIISGSIDNSLTITNCVISGNSATGAGTFGGGGISHSGGNLTVTGTTFSNNSTSTSGGGAGYSAGDPLGRTPSSGTLSVSGSTFTTNTANSAASGGGALDLFNFNLSTSTYNVNTSTFSGNQAPNGSGGAIIVESGPLTASNSSLTNNSAGNSGGAVFSAGSASITFSRLANNSVPVATSGLTLFNSGTAFSADDNWWGINTGPSPNDFRSTLGSVTPATYLQLRISASPTELCSGQSSALTADIKQRNVGSPLTTELNGLPTFPAVFSNAVLGTLSAATNFVNGVATATYTAGGTAGAGSADVTADNQTVTANITVSANNTTDPADQVVCQGQTANFSTTASGSGPIAFVWKKGATVLNNGDLGGRVTITSGATSSTLSISNVQASDADTYTVEATGACNTATQSASLTVNSPTTTSDPADQTVCQGQDAHFSTTAGGTGPFSYAWTLDGSPFNGNSPSITVPTGSLSTGSHTVEVTTTGACGSAMQSATLNVGSSSITAVGPANVWIGLKNSDDVGTKFDLLAEVLKDNVVVGSGQISDVPGGSSGFNNAVQRTIAMVLTGSGSGCSGGTLSFRLSVRIAASSTHVNGTARLWFNDNAANSRVDVTSGSTTTYYLRDGFVLATTPGPGPKKTIDVPVNRNVGGNPFVPFGTWSIGL